MQKTVFIFMGVLLVILAACGEKDNNALEPQNETSAALEDYFPLAKGVQWEYRVNFSQKVSVPYNPWFEYPQGLLGTTFTNGMGSWDKGQIDFKIMVNDVYKEETNTITWDINLDESGQQFFFYGTFFDSLRLRLHIENETAKLDLIGVMSGSSPRWRIARALVRLSSEDLSTQYDCSVPAGDYSNCVKSTVKIYGDGNYVPSGTYPIEIYLAPQVGIVKFIGKGSDGTILYTMELTGFTTK